MSGNQRLAICVAEAYNKPRKPRIPPFSSIEEQAIYGAYLRGMSMAKIAAIYGCSHHKIRAAVHRQHRAAYRQANGAGVLKH